MNKLEKLNSIHQKSLRQFDDIQSAVKEERKMCREDRRFSSVPGAMWEGNLFNIYENKPKYEINKIDLAVMRIISEYRNNRISVRFMPKKDSEYDGLADLCAGLFRADEQDSSAEEAYDNAFEEGIRGGLGAWRITTEYEEPEDEDDTKLRLKIEPIYDADMSVFFDLDAKKYDKSDARYCFVVHSVTKESFEDTWGESPSSWPKFEGLTNFDWCTPDVVYVAEYFVKEEATETVRFFRSFDGKEEKFYQSEFDEDEELEDKLKAIGSVESRRKKVKTSKVHKYILSGGGVLEDCGLLPGSEIPIVPFYAKRWFIDNVERCSGHVRLTKDIIRIKNMMMSKLAEISAMSSVEKPIFVDEQIAGRQQMWTDDIVKNLPFLTVGKIIGPDGSEMAAPPVAYTKSPNIPPALAALMGLVEQDLQDILGNPQAGEKIASNISGKSIEMVQQRLDMQTFLYLSNLSKSMKRCGEIWMSAAKDVYNEESRDVKIVSKDGESSIDKIMVPISEDGESKHEKNLNEAKFDVLVDVGPTSSTKRAATVKEMVGMMQINSDPETAVILSSLAMMNMEGEGLEDVRSFFRKRLLKLGAVKPTEQEQQELLAEMQAAQQDSPEATYMKAAADEALAKATKARADIIKSMADAELARSKSAEIDMNIGVKSAQYKIDAVEQMNKLFSESAPINDVNNVGAAEFNQNENMGNGIRQA